MSKAEELLIQTNQRVAELNRVPGFDPVKLLQGTFSGGKPTEGNQVQLILKYKKLWFRLACPHGRIRVTALRLTEQMAIIQAEIYRDKDDAKPVSNFVGSRTAHNTPGGLYIQAAEYEAVDNALTDAGFGIQLCDVCKAWGEEAYTPLPNQETAAAHGQDDPGRPCDAEQKEEVEQTVKTPAQCEVQREVQPQAAALPENGDADAAQGPEAAMLVSAVRETDAVPAAGSVCQVPEKAPNLETVQDQAGIEAMPDTEPAGDAAAEPAEPVYQAAEGVPESKPDACSDEMVQDAVVQPRPAEAPENTPVPAADEPEQKPSAVASGEMTLEEARNMIADVGSCRGKTLAQIADRRPTTLRWYFTTCPDSSERLKQAARLVFESLNLQQSA